MKRFAVNKRKYFKGKMNIVRQINHWANLIRESSDEYDSPELILERLDNFSPTRKLKVEYLNKMTFEEVKKLHLTFTYKTKSDVFEDVQEDEQIYFQLIRESYVLLLYVPSKKQYYKFVPTTNDIARLFLNSQKKENGGTGIFKQTQTVPKRLIVSTAEAARNIHRDENDYLLKETKFMDFSESSLKIIKRDLNQILHPEKYGQFEYKHLRNKIDRAKIIEQMKFDYGKIVSLMTRKSKNYQHRDNERIVILTEKGIEFVIDNVDKVLVSFAFKDCYGLGFHYAYTSDDVKSIPLSLVKNCLENDIKGYSVLDNNVVAT